MIFLLLTFFIALVVVVYFKFDREVACPALIFSFAYLVSVACACFNIKEWGISLHINTFLVLVFGALEFVFISYLVYKIFFKKYEILISEKSEILSQIHVSNIFLVLLMIYEIIVLVLLLFNVLNIASEFGDYNSFSEALTIYKNNTSYTVNASLPGYLTILMKPIMAGAYIGIYIFLNNFFAMDTVFLERIRKNAVYLIFPIFYIFQRIMESNRGSILNLVISFVVLAILLWSIKIEWKRYVSLKTIGKLFLTGCAGLILFYYSTTVVGRINTKGMFDYITYYAGGSIECFNQYMQQPDYIETIPGEYTFKNTMLDLKELGIVDETIDNSRYSAFIYYNDIMVGNIYTSYRSWLHDFGFVGLIILQAILSAVFNLLYYSIRFNLCRDYIKKCLILFYAYSIYTIFMHPIDSYFYLEFFTKATLLLIFVLYIMFWISLNMNITYRDKTIRLGIKEKKYEWYFGKGGH